MKNINKNKQIIKIAIAMLLVFATAIALCGCASTDQAEEQSNGTLVLIHTNDIHCAVDSGIGYSGLKAYVNQWESELGEDNVLLIDAGDVVQGGTIGTLTQGEALIEIMNAVEYDIFVPGNHEFDYGMDQAMYLLEESTASVLSANFVSLETNQAVFDCYKVIEYGSVKIGFVGMTTPETISTSTYFQDENGNMIYTFGENGTEMYQSVQAAIDMAIADGADLVVGIGHLGTEDACYPWRSEDLIANTTGIDIFIDGHSHTMDEAVEVLNKNGEVVVVNQTGSKFDAVGEIVINLDTLEFTVGYIPADFQEKDEEIESLIATLSEEFDAITQEVVATSEVDLLMSDPETGEYMVRNSATNLADLVTDALKYIFDVDVALCNAGGIRANIMAGDVTYGDIINVHPFANDISVISLSGQSLLDALEMGARIMPENDSALLQVSGVTYKVNTSIETGVITDSMGNFLYVEGEYRVTDVFVGGEELQLDKMYTVASNDYLLQSYGDGFTMFKTGEIVLDGIMIDSDVLISYIKENLGGVIGEEYASAQGRIEFYE